MTSPETPNISTTNDATPAPNKRRPRIIMLVVLIAVAGWAGQRYWHGLTHISTDNAQVAGRLVPILPKVGGFVSSVSVEENQRITAGSLLATIDDRDYRARLAQAEAELQIAFASAGKEGSSGQAESQLAASRASASAARSNIEQALANADKAQKDLERIRALVEKKMVSPQALDAAQAAARAAFAQVKVARDTATSAGEQVSASGAAVRAAQAKVDSARAARDLVAIALADTRIVAPADGTIGNRAAVPGQLVAAGQPIMNMITDDLWIIANLKETDTANVRSGQRVEIEIDAYPGNKFSGKVESLSPASGALFSVLPPDNATGNFTKVVQRIPVRIRFDKTDPAHPMRPGMSAFVTISTK